MSDFDIVWDYIVRMGKITRIRHLDDNLIDIDYYLNYYDSNFCIGAFYPYPDKNQERIREIYCRYLKRPDQKDSSEFHFVYSWYGEDGNGKFCNIPEKVKKRMLFLARGNWMKAIRR